MSEHDLQNEIRLALANDETLTLFRANVGKAWQGKIVDNSKNTLTLGNPRPFSTGLPKGFPDLFGIKTVEITPDMVGKKIGVFVFLEVKTPKGKASEEQKRVVDFLTNQGAVGGIVRTVEDAKRTIHEHS